MHARSHGRRFPLSLIVTASALMIFVIGTLLLNVYIDSRRRSTYDRTYESLAMDAVSRTVSQLSFRISLYETQMTGIAFTEELYNQLLRTYPDFISQWATLRSMEQAYQYVHSLLPGITQFRIYHDNPSFLENGGLLWKPGNRLLDGNREKDWYMQHLTSGRPEWSVYAHPYSGESYSVLSTGIPRGAAGCVGVIYLRLSNLSAFGSALKGDRAQHALADPNGIIFLATDPALQGKSLEDTAFPSLTSARISAYGSDTVSTETADGFHILNRLGNGWQLYSFVPMAGLSANLNRLNILYRIGVMIVVALGAAAVLTVLHYFRFRLKKLSRRLQSDVPELVHPGIEQTALSDQVDQVEAHYGHLVRQMKDLRLREMEEAMRAMESYVNPHFLYNTLGLIRWRALDDGDEELCQLVDDMTTYYRLSLSGGKSVVTVADEMAHLEAYISIQQRRWGDMVQAETQTDPEALESYVPKNILQTIVENCYVHGMVPGRSGLHVYVRVRRDHDQVMFTVEDDGMGIEPERLAFLNREDDTEITGIGIRSVRQRLLMYYGSDMTMHISSEMGRGTRVLIRIPFSLTEPSIPGGE